MSKYAVIVQRRRRRNLLIDRLNRHSPAYNGHFSRTCYRLLFVFNQFDDLAARRNSRSRKANRHQASAAVICYGVERKPWKIAEIVASPGNEQKSAARVKAKVGCALTA
jgi:hypothetical protein